ERGERTGGRRRLVADDSRGSPSDGYPSRRRQPPRRRIPLPDQRRTRRDSRFPREHRPRRELPDRYLSSRVVRWGWWASDGVAPRETGRTAAYPGLGFRDGADRV